MLIFRMAQGACHWWFCQKRLPISNKWMSATNRNLTYLRCKAKNCWRSVDAHSKNGAVTVTAISFANKCGQYVRYAYQRASHWWITKLTRPQIVDALLTLMLRMGRWPCCYLFCQWKLPIRRLCITTTRSLVNYRNYKTTNCWCSVDAHAKSGAVTVLLSLLPMKAANRYVMHNNDQVTGELLYLQDQK